MPCSCHGAKGEAVQGQVPPDSPCTVCAAKHINLAATAWGEFTYENDNREFVAGHLRLAGEHLKINHRALALEVRDAAVVIEMARDKNVADVAGRIRTLQASVRAAFNMEHPDVMLNLSKLAPVPQPDKVDLIIPLGSGSPFDNCELRILLRSLEKNCTGLGRVIIVTDCAPAWLNTDKVSILNMGDKTGQGKDANLIDKTLAAIEQYSVDSFIWSCDDHVIMKPLDLRVAPKLYNSRGPDGWQPTSRWRSRMLNTFKRFPELTVNYDTHSPQPFKRAQRLLKAMRGVDYVTDPGLCILTTFYAVLGETDRLLTQSDYKHTIEGPVSSDFNPSTKLYVGYNDTGFAAIRDKLLKVFPEKSSYELTELDPANMLSECKEEKK